MAAMNCPVIFVTALHCEAKPLIAHYRMKRVHTISAFKVFQNEGYWLIVSGVGKVAAASAVGFLAGRLHDLAKKSLWLNIGIARHVGLNVGECQWLNKVIDQATGKTLYPMPCSALKLSSSACVTVDAVNYDEDSNHFYDMEASGYFFRPANMRRWNMFMP